MSDRLQEVLLENRIARCIRPEIRAMAGYRPVDDEGRIRMEAKESPFGVPAPLDTAWGGALATAELNRYPDPTARPLRAELRQQLRLPDGVELLLGNGSDELIQAVMLAVGGGDDRRVLVVEPSFAMYRILATVAGLDVVAVPLNPLDYSLQVPEILAALARYQPALVLLASPNNPTGNRFSDEALRAVIEASTGLVVLDEAYAPFTAAGSRRAWLAEYEHLLVMGTLSKTGLAGLRLGYLAGAAPWLAEFDKVRLPYNVNRLTQAAAELALAHWDAYEAQIAEVRAQRDWLFEQLAALPDVRPSVSNANFLLFRLPPGRAEAVHQGVLARGILIKQLHGSHPLLEDCLQVTVGTPDENRAFVTALREALAEH